VETDAGQATERPIRPFPPESFYDLLVAEIAVRRGDYSLALANYLRQALATRDAEVAARATRLAQYLRADGEALQAAQLWVELEPEDVEARFALASLLAKARRPQEAMPHMIKVMESGARANFAAIAASAAELPAQTQRELLQQIEAVDHADNTELMTGKALLLQQLGQREQALQLIRQVLERVPDDTHALIIEARLLQEMDRHDEAFTRLSQMVEQYPYNRRLRLQYARLLTETDLARAQEQFEILVQQSPNDGELLLSLALICRERGETEAAEAHFNQLLARGQHINEAHYYLGQLAEQRRDRDAAIGHYEQVTPGDEFLPALGRVIDLRLQAGDFDSLHAHLGALRNSHPEHAVRLYLLESELLMQRKAYKEGHTLLSEALRRHPGQQALLYARSMFSEKRRDLPLLERDLREILTREPDNAVALNALGYSLLNMSNRYAEAYQLIQRAHELKPDDPAILDSLGWAEYRRGNLGEARRLLERAYAAFPDEEVAAHLGEVLFRLGEKEKARELLLNALQKDPNSDLVREAIRRFVETPPGKPDK
jgi:tetratricopeptide (TPR) repeat protein